MSNKRAGRSKRGEGKCERRPGEGDDVKRGRVVKGKRSIGRVKNGGKNEERKITRSKRLEDRQGKMPTGRKVKGKRLAEGEWNM